MTDTTSQEFAIQTWFAELPNQIRLSCRSCGRQGNPILLFLHGFPEGAFAWDEMLTHFAKPENGGYYCIAPNLRGYEHSSSPSELSAYQAENLADDIKHLIDECTTRTNAPLAALIAHDWGGIVAWHFASLYPDYLNKFVIINSPHPQRLFKLLNDNPAQQTASGYVNLFSSPNAETILANDDFALLWQSFTGATWLTDELKDEYRKVWQCGLTGGLNYYRAAPIEPRGIGEPAFSSHIFPDDAVTVKVPTLVIWGVNDRALVPALLDGLEKWVPNLTVHRLDGSHWVIHEQPDEVARLIGEFITKAD